MGKYDDWEDELSRPDSFPLAAAIAGSIVIVALAVFVLPMLHHPPFWQTVVGMLAAALVIWLAGFAITIRHATTAWKLGTLALLLVVGATTALGTRIYDTMRLREDMRTIAEFRMRPDGTPTFPAGAAARGPISRLYIAFINGTVEDRQKLDAAALKIGIDLLGDPDGLTRTPGVLGKCGEIPDLKTIAAENSARQRQRQRDFQAGLDAVDAPDDFKQGLRKGWERDTSDLLQRQMLKAQEALFDESHGLCTVLARRRWEPQFRQFMFTNAADLAEFRLHAQRRDKAVEAMRRIEAEGQRRLELGQRLVRQGIGR
jgi:hypothetical protein